MCGRFSGRVIKGINANAPTPEWMKQRLERSGQRSISAIVDISNYVMLEGGQPNHIYDLDKIDGGLTIRWGKKGEKVKLLNDMTVEVDEWVGIIADNTAVEFLGGIMGGDRTSVSSDTRNIYIEVAFWWPDAIRGRARRYNFSTDASHRFERLLNGLQRWYWKSAVSKVKRPSGLSMTRSSVCRNAIRLSCVARKRKKSLAFLSQQSRSPTFSRVWVCLLSRTAKTSPLRLHRIVSTLKSRKT